MVEAKHIGIVFIVAASLVVLVAFVSRQPGGWIETSKGSVCSWRTGGDASTNRVLKLDCKCFGKNGNEVEYSCEYVGVPQKTCSRYKTLIFEFFEQMLNSIKGQPHGCSLKKLTGEHVEVCKGLSAFSMIRKGDATPAECK